MRKRIVGSERTIDEVQARQRWIALGQIATVEVTSEDPNFPIESVFDTNGGPGWRASEKGEQQVRLIFDHPLSVHRMQLQFLEPDHERMQEFTIRWSSAEGGQPREIVRQQWNFSPDSSTTEIEDYEVSLDRVAVLELVIRPDVSRDEALGTLAAWRLA